MTSDRAGAPHPSGSGNRRFIAVLLMVLYFSSTFAFVGYAYWLKPRIVVGIVGAQDVGDGDMAFIADALERFDDGFDARVMAYRLNDSAFPSENGTWLGFSYLYTRLPAGFYGDNDLDIVMVVANRSLVKDFEERISVWGIASTTYARATMTVDAPTSDPARRRDIIETTAVHEILHLMGYTHPRDECPCVMSSGHIGTQLCGGQEWELPLRQSLWKLGRGVPFPIAMFELGVVLAFLLAPAFALAMHTGAWALQKVFGTGTSYEFKVYSFGVLYASAVIGTYLRATPNERMAILTAAALGYIVTTAGLLAWARHEKGERGAEE